VTLNKKEEKKSWQVVNKTEILPLANPPCDITFLKLALGQFNDDFGKSGAKRIGILPLTLILSMLLRDLLDASRE
jgi:hypothetical protein